MLTFIKYNIRSLNILMDIFDKISKLDKDEIDLILVTYIVERG